jgi:hypothetical protein
MTYAVYIAILTGKYDASSANYTLWFNYHEDLFFNEQSGRLIVGLV